MTDKSEKSKTKVSVGRNVFSWRPEVSVVIPAYNSAAYIAETIESVRNQKFRDLEIIIVNDGSPDTHELERELSPFMQEIVYVRQQSSGAGGARNTGIENARADLIAFLDSDDIWLPEFLASQIAFLGRGFDMVYCDAVVFRDGSPLRTSFMAGSPSEGEVNCESLLEGRCNVITSGTVVRKDALLKAGLFERGPVKAEDFHLWMRMAKQGSRIGYQRKQLVKYRVRPASLSGDTVDRIIRSIDAFRRVRETIDLSSSELDIIDRRLQRFHADLAVARGKTYLVNGEYQKAATEFSEASRCSRSLKLRVISLLARVAPRTLLRIYRSQRVADLSMLLG